MTPLGQRMLEDMQLHGFAARTQEAYLHAVSQLAKHFGQSPDKLSEEQLREYFLYMVNVKKVARATHTIALCGIKFCFERTLDRTWSTLELVRPARHHNRSVASVRGRVEND